ncbi:MAG TPA: hypothetical protein VF740_04615 [Candidatus Acidoferrum sp.]
MSFHLADISGVRSAVNAVRNAVNQEGQLEQAAPNQNAYKEGDESHAQIDKSIGGRFLETNDRMGDDPDASAQNPNDIENLDDAAHELVLKREVNETRKEVLIVGHEASWLDFNEEPGFLLGTANG